MKQSMIRAMISLLASAALPVLAANPPPAAPPPPPPPAAPITFTICHLGGEELAACAASWEQFYSNGNKVDGLKMAWEASGYENFIAALRYENQDSSWCQPAGAPTTLDDASKTVAKYLKDNSDKLKSTPSDVLVDKALHEAYPCTKKGAH